MKNFLPIFIIVFLSVSSSFAQGGCGCVNCPQLMPDNFSGGFILDIVGATNNDLSDPFQGICGVNLNFDHQYIGDLGITLTSPGGQTITLVGPIGLFGESDFSTYEISFIPCNETPVTDGGPAVYNNLFMTAQNFDFTGSYHPNSGCLEDFNMGPINGTWTLTVTDGQPVDAGIFNDYEIIFCDDSGIDCNTNPCGVMAEAEAPSFACIGDTIIIDASGSTGNTYMWGTDDGEFIGVPSGPFAQIAVSGTYSVTVSDNGACPEVASVIFETVPEVPTAEIFVNGIIDCNSTEVTLEGSTDISEDLFVNWILGAEIDENNFSPIGMELDLDITEAGTYTMIIINTESACSQTATVIVEDESELPAITFEAVDTIDCINTDVALSGSSSLNQSTFSWSGPGGFANPTQNTSASEPGEYTLTVTGANGCVDSASVVIISDTIAPNFVALNTNDIDCVNLSSFLGINSSEELSTIDWSGPNNFLSDIENPEVNEGGQYTLVATGPNGCSSTSVVQVVQSADVPEISTVPDGVVTCNDMEYDISGISTTFGATYEWSGPNGFSSTSSDPGMVSDTGTYSLTVSAPNGCSITSYILVTSDTNAPEVLLDSPALLGCSNTTTTLTSSTTESGLTYEWTGPNGQSFSDPEPLIEGDGTYNLIVTGANGCQNNYSVVVDTDDTPPIVDVEIDAADILSCNETQITVINNAIDPDYTYTWTSSTGFDSNEATPDLSEGGIYNVVVTGLNGCTVDATVEVLTDTISPNISFTTNELTCQDNMVMIGVSSTDNIMNYDWTSDNGYTSTEQNPSDIIAGGIYTAVITAENGCTSSVSFEVTQSVDLPDGQINAPQGTTFDCALTSVELNASSSIDGATFTWTDVNANEIAGDILDADAVGEYILTITGPNGCTATETVTIDEDLSGPEITANPDVNLECDGDVMLIIQANENINAYEWSGPGAFSSNIQNPLVGSDGIYDVIITGDNGCTSTSSVEVINMQIPPDIFVDPTQTLVCGQNQITLNGGSDDANTASVTYNWDTDGGNIIDGINSSSVNVNAPGTYILTVINNDTGCEATDEVIVGQDTNIPQSDIIALQSNTINCNFTSIILDANGSDVGNGFSFVWGNVGGNDISNETNLETTITEAGTYFITVTNTSNQCSSISSIAIDVDDAEPLISLSAIGELDCNVTSLNINNTAVNMSQNLEYEWMTTQGGNITSSNNNGDLELDMPGTYTLLLTDTDNGCETSETFMVSQNIASPIISAGSNTTLDCGVTALTLQGSIDSGETDIDIVWTGQTSPILSGENTLTPEVGAAGIYNLVITNNETGCSEQSSVTIEPNMDLPVIEFEPAVPFNCATSSYILDASSSSSGPGIIYSWISSTGANVFGGDTATPEIFESGEYFLTIINTDNNCQTTNSIIVQADTLSPTVSASAADQLSCTLNEVSLNIDSDIAGLDLQWTALSGNIVSGETSPNPAVDQAGEYELVVTSQQNQCTATALVSVEVDENTPSVMIDLPEQLTCNFAQLELDAGNSSQGVNISIAWSNEGGNFVSGEDGLNPIIDMPGIYTLTLSDSNNGCEVSQSVEVFENREFPEALIDAPSTINCKNETYTVQAVNQGTSDYTYSWETMNGNIISGANTLNPELDEDGLYELTIIDTQNGCQSTAEIIVEKDTEDPDIVVNDNFDLTCPNPNAVIDGTGSTTGSDISYSWTDDNNVELFNTLNAQFTAGGTYTLEVINNENGCSNTAMVVINDLRELPDVEIEMPQILTCNDIAVQLVAQDLNGQNLEYNWSDMNGNSLNALNTASTIDVDEVGVYTLNVIDPINECEETYTVEVFANQVVPVINVDPENNGMITCDKSSIELSSSINGLDIDDVTLLWTTAGGNFINGENSLTPLINAAGIYTLSITDISNGCNSTVSVSIEADATLPLASLNEPEILNCNVSSTTLSVADNTGNIEYIWTLDGNTIPNTNSNEIVVSEPGIYMIQVVNNDNGCNSDDVVIVSQDSDLPIISAGNSFELQCDEPEYLIQAVNDGNANYIIEWDQGNGNIVSGESTLNPLVNAAGIYTLTVSNSENGCISTDDVIITVNENIPTDILAATQNPLCIDDLGSLSIQDVVGGEGPYAYSIDGGYSYSSNVQFESLSAGTYTLSILDNNGCEVQEEINIAPAQAIGVELPGEIEILLGDSATLAVNLDNIDPADIESIQWTPSASLSCDDCLSPTTSTTFDINYTVEVILGSGCSATDNIQLRVDRNFDIYIPNAFSPFNKDGVNDVFYLFAKENVVDNIGTFTIYDRWGTRLFHKENIQANDASEAWTGIYRNEELQPDVYVYVIEVEYRNGFKEVLKGDITLMK